MILAALLTAHALGDFVFQTRHDVSQKHRGGVLLKHGFVHAVLSYVLVGIATAWIIPTAIFGSHVLIDYVKTRFGSKGLVGFLVDQASHLLVIGALAGLYAALLSPAPSLWIDAFGGTYTYAVTALAGFVITVRMGAFFVDFAVEPFLAQIRYQNSADERVRGLRDGGRTIGQLERALIFVFVVINQFTAIGFLIAAKSIFRFGELRERGNRMEAEYIIIGTLISFLWAIVAALITAAFLG